MARRRRSRDLEERDESTPSLTPVVPQAPLRADVVTPQSDLRLFHPEPEFIHAVQHYAATLKLAPTVRASTNRSRQLSQRVSKPVRANTKSHQRLRLRLRSLLHKLHRTTRNQTRHRAALRRDFKFTAPDQVAVCVRRKERREIIFASGNGGARRHRKKPKRNYFSDIRCK